MVKPSPTRALRNKDNDQWHTAQKAHMPVMRLPGIASPYARTHDHTIPGVNLPGGPIEDHCDQGTLWDPVANAYFYSYDAPSNSFKAYDGTSPTNWLQYVGEWGDQQYPDSDPRQKKVFGIAATAKYTGGPTGPEDKSLNRPDVCPPRDNTACFISPLLRP
ncbi:MAG: hypothetical protein LQ352_002073 [Teloschistes flavicans]|nr:MAG: hypothetical protein LQ352_002073 [Teloschistes flavicans]